MPRGNKSKRRARQKRPQARGDNKGGEDAQEAVPSTAEAMAAEAEGEATAAVVGGEEQEAEKEPSSSQDPRGAASCSHSSTPQCRPPCANDLSGAETCASSDKVSDYKGEENISVARPCAEHFMEEHQYQVEILKWFMLQKFHLKQTFTRAEMIESLNPRFRHDFPELFKHACEHVEVIFAVEVIEVESTHHSYNLFSKLTLPNSGRIRPGRGYPKTGLLMKVLAVIVMKDHRAPEEVIWTFLKKMQVHPSKRHMMFGDTKKLLTQDFVRLNYLVYHQVPGSDPACHEFLWGPEAHAETNKEKILKFFKKVNKVCPTYFTSLCEDAKKEEIERFHSLISSQSCPTANPRAVARATCPGAHPKSFDI
ncbi:PREDICTED: melanoma-associated antigen B5-like [Chinchilla lanigera]|uniref:melanoma-associated antigen B5-like n=1 Tax=Chinchilla lanigera TaxID=34839 RepID=UPI00038F0FDB|nr:PREDICTED: melanoma-associated antigen B5-like [Chinchilla lanigera]